MKNTDVIYNRIMDKQLREEMKALILSEFDDKSFRRGNLFDRYRTALASKNLPMPGWRKLNNLFYTVSKNLIYDNLLKPLSHGTYYANSAGIVDDETEEEFVGMVEDGEMSNDEEPEMALTKVVGHGRYEVYLYYYPSYRQLAQLKGEQFFRCKIGMTTKGDKRFSKPFNTDAPERRYVAIRIRTDVPEEVEKYFHSALKAAGRQCKTYGREWFMTNPEEVLRLYVAMTDLYKGDQEDCFEEPMCTTI